jgi:hypothetical protein
MTGRANIFFAPPRLCAHRQNNVRDGGAAVLAKWLEHNSTLTTLTLAYARPAVGAAALEGGRCGTPRREALRAVWIGGDGRLLPALARTIAWLARQRLVYTDLRAPNVLVDGEGKPWLVDFDDVLVLPAAVTSLQGYLAALATCPGAQQWGTFATSLCAGGEQAVMNALHCAFEEEGAQQGGGVGGGGLGE